VEGADILINNLGTLIPDHPCADQVYKAISRLSIARQCIDIGD